jgi:ribosomal protein S21
VEYLPDGHPLHSFKTYDKVVPLMAINVEITRNNNENSASVLRRFMKKVRGAGFLQEVRDRRYYSRVASKLRRKNSKMVSLARYEKFVEQEKLGQGIKDVK